VLAQAIEPIFRHTDVAVADQHHDSRSTYGPCPIAIVSSLPLREQAHRFGEWTQRLRNFIEFSLTDSIS